MENTDKLAVLIDADNAQPSIVDSLQAEIANYGVASVKRIYGDWTSPSLKGWKEVLLEHSIQPIQQFGIVGVGRNVVLYFIPLQVGNDRVVLPQGGPI